MPFVNLKIVKQQVTDHQKQMLIDGIMDIILNIMGRDKNLTVITFDEYDLSNWVIGGRPISSKKDRIVCYGEIKISRGTSPPEEMEKVIQAFKKLVKNVLDSDEIANYIVINELNPDAWGFDGSSMSEKRRQAEA